MPIGEKSPDNIERTATIEMLSSKQESQKIESLPDVSEFSQEKISDLDAGQKEIRDLNREESKRIEERYKPSPEIFGTFRQKLSAVAKKAEGFTDKAKKGIKEAAKGAVIGGMLAATAGIAEGNVLEKPSGKTQEGVKAEELQENITGLHSEEIEAIKKSAELYNKRISELKKAAFEDESERVLITSKKDGSFESVEDEESERRLNFSFIPFKKIDDFIKNGAKKVEIIHTHPWAALPKYFQDARIRDGKPIPMPPSISDLNGLMLELHHFKENNKFVENKIIDPTGEWTFKIEDENNYFIKKYVALIEKADNPEFFTKEEKEESLKNADLIKNIHPDQRQYYASRMRDKIVNEFIKEFPEKELFDLFGEDKSAYLKNYIEVKKLAEKIYKYDENRTDQETKVLMEEYKEKCKKIGFNISYKPF